MYSFLWNSASFRAALNTERAEEAAGGQPGAARTRQLSAGGAGLTVSHQHQGALGFGPAVVDLDGVGALAGSGEVVHRHLDNSRRHVMADFVPLREMKMLSGHVLTTTTDQLRPSSELQTASSRLSCHGNR